MERITKSEAIALHRKMWNYIADETVQRETVVSKVEAIVHIGVIWQDVAYRCFCCEYGMQHFGPTLRCAACPIAWPKGSNCYEEGELYDLWEDTVDTGDWLEAARLAREIANLPEKE